MELVAIGGVIEDGAPDEGNVDEMEGDDRGKLDERWQVQPLVHATTTEAAMGRWARHNRDFN